MIRVGNTLARLEVTENLQAALLRLQRSSGDRVLWVDAVCINQHDDSEKSCQVALMPQIFGKADEVLGWFGEGNEQTTVVIRILRGLAASASKYGVDTSEEEAAVFTSVMSERNESFISAVRELSLGLDYDTLKVFFGQYWFQRLWVVQRIRSFVFAHITQWHRNTFNKRFDGSNHGHDSTSQGPNNFVKLQIEL